MSLPVTFHGTRFFLLIASASILGCHPPVDAPDQAGAVYWANAREEPVGADADSTSLALANYSAANTNDEAQREVRLAVIDRKAVDAAFAFISAQQDLFHKQFDIAGEMDSGGQHFFASGWMGDLAGLPNTRAKKILTESWASHPKRGLTCIRIAYPKDLNNKRWVGIYYQFPDGNWTKPGFDLRRYVKGRETPVLKFFARAERNGTKGEFKVGGTDGDTFGPMSTGVVTLSTKWREFSIPIRLAKRAFEKPATWKSLVGGLCWATNLDLNPNGAVTFIDDARIEFGPKGSAVRLNEPHFVRSYVPEKVGAPDRYFRNASYLYDNSLMILAYCARRKPDDLRRARLIGNAIVYAQKHDLIHDDRLRNAYSCGDLSDPSQNGIPRLPGWWDAAKNKWIEDHYFASTDVGNMAWCAIALESLYEVTRHKNGRTYLEAARKICEWIHKNTYSKTGPGGYTGGFERTSQGEKRLTFKSTEHNIDVYVAFQRLSTLTGDKKWEPRAEHARRFVEQMLDPLDGHFWTGTREDGKSINKSPIPLDVAPWALLGFRSSKRYRRAVEWAHQHCWVNGIAGNPGLRGYDFNADDRDGVWWEGTAQMQLAHRMLGNRQRANDCIHAIRNFGKSKTSPGAVVAATPDGVTTGFVREWGDWKYYQRAQAGGATCWYLFAELGWNPYWNEPVK